MLGPVELTLSDGSSVDLFLIRFGKDGRLQSPRTAAMAIERARTATDVYLFSHGWNTIFDAASSDYGTFIAGYVDQRRQFGIEVPVDYRPVLIGVIWPSTWFVNRTEEGPAIAANAGDTSVTELLDEIVDDVPADSQAELVELLDGAQSLSREQAQRAAELLSTLWTDPDETSMSPPDVDQLLEVWSELDGDDDVFGDVDDIAGTIDDETATDVAAPDVAIAGGGFDPRSILRAASVWKMKARAGDVGKHGVGPFLAQLLEGGARAHLIGHSYGARVLLSAIARTDLPAKVYSLLLLQPAVNRWCFAKNVAETGREGGYANVPGKVVRPIVMTFSQHDNPLHEIFHLFVRGDSLGEFNAAAFGATDRYGALGGYGPLGVTFSKEDALAAGGPYKLEGRFVAIDGASRIGDRPAINGHGDVNSPVTWWMLHAVTER